MCKKVLLINPPFERLIGYSRYYCPLGLLSLGTVLKQEGHIVKVYDADYNPKGENLTSLEMYERYSMVVEELDNFSNVVWAEIEEVIKEFNPDYLGVSVYSSAVKSAKEVIQIARRLNPNVTIFVGGAHASICPHDLVGIADYVMRFEGEHTISDVINGRIEKGIVFGERIKDIDSLPIVDYTLLHNLDSYEQRDLSMLISTRGCPYACKFCSSPFLWKRKVTRKSVERFIREMTILKDTYGVHDFFITDDTFICNKAWMTQFCEEVKKLEVTWRCLGRLDQMDSDLLDQMYSAGCRNVKLGIESGSQRILDMIDKKITIDQVLKISNLLAEKNINWSAYFMIGLPSETEADIRKTQELIKKITATNITLSIYTPFPNDQLYTEKIDDYTPYCHHSNNNNFTGTISNERFRALAIETLLLCNTDSSEHNI